MPTAFAFSSLSSGKIRPSLPRSQISKCPLSIQTPNFKPRCVSTSSAPGASSTDTTKTKQEDLRRMQQLYVYKSPETLPGIAFVEGPSSRLNQAPSYEWRQKVALASIDVLKNLAGTDLSVIGVAVETLLRAASPLGHDEARIDDALQFYADRVDKDSHVLAEQLKKNFATAGCGGNFEEENPVLSPYRMMWSQLKRPDLAECFMEDKTFARLRVAGYNPMSLRRVFKREDMPFEIRDEDLPWQGDSLHAMIREERLYMHDFSALMAIEQDKHEGDKKFVSTAALYGVKPGGGDLEVIAIRCDEQLCVRPKAGADSHEIGLWSIAKTAVNQNDAMHHEVVAHLGGTHLLMEPFVIATMRQLHHTHALHRLLVVHFEGTIHINDRATRNLIKDGGNVDKIFAGDINSVREFVVQDVLNTGFNSRMPDVEMKRRGVMSSMLNMPYRDDALEHYDAMKQWVRAYLAYYYPNDAAVAADTQLQQWALELTDETRGRVKGFGEDNQGKLTTVDYLVDVVAFLMFTASVQHAAVNFPQFGMMSYSPAVPGALYGAIPRKGDKVGVEDWCKLLTPVKRSIEQIMIMSVIGNIYHTQLGEYEKGSLPNKPHVSRALEQYQARLRRMESRISAREKGEEMPYSYLMPSKVPMSINI